MPKTLMQSVVSQLQMERTRLENELHRITDALAAFGKVYLHGSKGTRTNHFGRWTQANSGSSEGTLGED